MGFSYQSTSRSSLRTVLSGCSLLLLASLLSLPASAQDLTSDTPHSDFSVSQLRPDDFIVPDDDVFADHTPEPLFNPYRLDGLEPAIEQGIISQEAGHHAVAISAFEQALQITRIRYGLYSETQIPLLEGIINSGMELQDWEMVDERYAYMEHLYRKLYAIDDPRLERGLQKISSFHVNAFNINLDGRREYHLRRAAKLFQTRLQVAENTLAEDHPRFQYLNEGIEISRQHLYIMSNAQREALEKKRASARDNLLADLD